MLGKIEILGLNRIFEGVATKYFRSVWNAIMTRNRHRTLEHKHFRSKHTMKYIFSLKKESNRFLSLFYKGIPKIINVNDLLVSCIKYSKVSLMVTNYMIHGC